MNPITDLQELISNMEPILNEGEYIFATVSDINTVPREKTICEIVEKEGVTVVMKKINAAELGLKFDFIASWITLDVHSALEAVGPYGCPPKVLLTDLTTPITYERLKA